MKKNELFKDEFLKQFKTGEELTGFLILTLFFFIIGIFFMFYLGWFMEALPKEGLKSSSYDLFNLGIYTWELAKEASPRSFYFVLGRSF